MARRTVRSVPGNQVPTRTSFFVLPGDLDAAARHRCVTAARRGRAQAVECRLHWEDDVNLVEVDGMPGGPKQHPVKQVRGYATHVADFARAPQGDDEAVAGASSRHRRLLGGPRTNRMADARSSLLSV